jgi:lambda family phage portal protein
VKWTRVKAYGTQTGLPNILHILDTERPDQYRGVTYLAPVIEPLLNISRYTQSELMAALIQSFFTAWIVTEANPAQIPINEVGYGPDDDPDNPPDSYASENPNEYEMGPGTMIHLKQGEDVKFGEPHIPSTGFDTFVKVICKEIGAALNIPYDTLLKEFNASYSASRAALMEAWESFRIRRENLVYQFCQPVYEVWLSEAVALGRIKAPGFFIDPAVRAAWCKCQWLGPVQGQLDPTKEVKADILAVQHGFKTHEQVTREYGGGDWNENMERLKQEMETLQEAGLGGRSDNFQNEPDLNPEDDNEGNSEGNSPNGGENNNG